MRTSSAHEGEELLVILNGAGATTLMELLIVFRRVAQVLEAKKIRLVRSAVGEFITTQEQAGFQMMIARMDPELIASVGCAGRLAVFQNAMRDAIRIAGMKRDVRRGG